VAVPRLTQHRKRKYGGRQRGRVKSVNELAGHDTLGGVEAYTTRGSIESGTGPIEQELSWMRAMEYG
jgi:hypothetical protein